MNDDIVAKCIKIHNCGAYGVHGAFRYGEIVLTTYVPRLTPLEDLERSKEEALAEVRVSKSLAKLIGLKDTAGKRPINHGPKKGRY